MENTLNYQQVCEEVCRLAQQVGIWLCSERQHLSSVNMEVKGVHDYVTQFDKQSEKTIVGRLKELVPGCGFIAEEKTETVLADRFNWIVDPLDGTTNFIHGLPPTAISIALREKEEIVIGVVYEIWRKECFYAYKGGKAYMNGYPIHVSDCPNLDSSLLATGFPYSDFSILKPFMQYLEWSMQHTHGLRRLGSAATDLIYTACGRCDGYFEYGMKPYDVAAGAFIAQQAGAQVTDFSGGDNWLFGGEIVVSGPALFPEFLQSLQQFLK
ncbi:MAG: inositol monophosphatase [Bacteroidales bacterium]|nr:inositol monophosphatase [Bacteroidales bacterium]